MTKVAEPQAEKKSRNTEKVEADNTSIRNRSGLTAAEKIVQSSGGWVGDDLDEIIDVVSATRSRSRF